MGSGGVMTDFRQMFATKNRNECRENRDYVCGLGSRGTVQGGFADMYRMHHDSRCTCQCPTKPLLSSPWPLYNQALDNFSRQVHHHRLLALSGIYNPIECQWKSLQILEYKGKVWVVVTKMPTAIVSALFQVTSFNFVQAWSHESLIYIKRMGDAQINGAWYDLDQNTWGTEWRVPPNAVPWFRSVYPIQELCAPWEMYMTGCYSQLVTETDQMPDVETVSTV